MGGNYQAVQINLTRYYAVIGHVNDTVETDVRVPVPAGTMSTLRAYYQPAAHANTVTFTLLKNGVATALTCTVAANATTCSDSTNSFTTADGDQLTMRGVSSANVTPSAVSFTVLFSPN